MQAQLHVQPPLPDPPSTLLHLPDLSRPSRSPVMDKEPPSVVQSGPSYPHSLHVLLDDHVSRSGTRDHISSNSPQRHSISVSNQSRPTSLLPPSHPRPHLRVLALPDSTSCPRPETRPSAHFSSSPSPPQIRPTPLFPPPYSAPHHQNRFASSATSYPPNMDRYSITNPADCYLRVTDKYPHNQHSLLDQRRMSEPAMYGNSASGYSTNAANLSNARHQQLQHQYPYVPSQSHSTHPSSPRRSLDARPIGGSPWKEDHQLPLPSYDSIELEEPLSPLNPTFSGGESPPPIGVSGMAFGSLHEDYGPSPPGTGTSTSSIAPATHQQGHTIGESSSASNSKQYSFVSLPGNVVKKRPRRRYDEIERLYQCSWQNCTKAYGTLNHLNAHITMQKHGPKRSPNEFKELRKQWRKAKKEEAETSALDAARHGSHQTPDPSQCHSSPHSMPSAVYQTHDVYAHHPARSGQPIGPVDDLHDPLAHQRDGYPHRSQRYAPFFSPQPQHSGVAYPHPHAHGTNASNIHMNRLPASSTLPTPLPGYEPSSMSGAPDFGAYGPYRSDGRSGISHGSPASHGDRARSRSSHIGFGPGHHRDGGP